MKKNGQRNRDPNDQRAFPVAEKDQNHDGSETRCDHGFAHYAFNRGGHEYRLIKKHRNIQGRRQRLLKIRDFVLNSLHDIERRCITSLLNGEEGGPLTVKTNKLVWGMLPL